MGQKLQRPSFKEYREAPRHDEKAMLDKISEQAYMYLCTPKSMRTDEFIISAIGKNTSVFNYLSKEQQKSQLFIDACVRACSGYEFTFPSQLPRDQVYSRTNYEYFYEDQLKRGITVIVGSAMGRDFDSNFSADFVRKAYRKSDAIRQIHMDVAKKIITKNAEELCNRIARYEVCPPKDFFHRECESSYAKYWTDQINKYCPEILPMLKEKIDQLRLEIENKQQSQTQPEEQKQIDLSDLKPEEEVKEAIAENKESEHEESIENTQNDERPMSVEEMIETIESNWDVFVEAIESGEISTDALKGILGVSDSSQTIEIEEPDSPTL